MKTLFDRFVEMAKEEFGYTVILNTNKEKATFESLFGVSTEDISQYELPYNISADQFTYYDDQDISNTMMIKLSHAINKFEVEERCNFAA